MTRKRVFVILAAVAGTISLFLIGSLYFSGDDSYVVSNVEALHGSQDEHIPSDTSKILSLGKLVIDDAVEGHAEYAAVITKYTSVCDYVALDDSEDRTIYVIDRVQLVTLPDKNAGDNGPGASSENKMTDSSLLKDIVGYLSDGSFYFSRDVRIDRTLQCNLGGVCAKDDQYYTTNHRLLDAAASDPHFSEQFHTIHAIRGRVNSYSDAQRDVQAILFTRHSPRRSGPRLQCRGLDSEGNSSLTVESEIVLCSRLTSRYASYATVRGTVPIKWQQRHGWAVAVPKQEFSEDAALHAGYLRKHVALLKSLYNNGPVVGLSLLRRRRKELAPGEYRNELSLGQMYEKAAKMVPDLKLVSFDFHGNVHRHGSEWYKQLDPLLPTADISFFAYDGDRGAVVQEQHGVVRVNCLTVIDRTNATLAHIMYNMLPDMLARMQADAAAPDDALAWLREAWADAASSISWQNCGSETQQLEMIRKGNRSTWNKWQDRLTIAGRHWHSNWVHDRLFKIMKLIHGYSSDE